MLPPEDLLVYLCEHGAEHSWSRLEWLVAVGRNKDGEIFFYDTGGDIIEDLGTLEYLKERIIRAHFGEDID